MPLDVEDRRFFDTTGWLMWEHKGQVLQSSTSGIARLDHMIRDPVMRILEQKAKGKT